MPICPYGAEVRPGAPTTFVFDEAYVLGALGLLGNVRLGIAGFVLLTALGLPTDPQNTAAYVAVEPEGEQPTAEDWVKLFFPPIALFTGTYTRFGNWIRLAKWQELAVCKPAGSIPPEGEWTYLCTVTHTCADGTGIVMNRCGPFRDFDYYRATLIEGADLTALGIQVALNRGLVIPGDSYGSTLANQQAVGQLTEVGQFVDLAVGEGVNTHNDFYTFTACGGSWAGDPPRGTITIAGHTPPPPPTEPDVPKPEVDAGCDEVADFADVGDALCELRKQLNRIEAKIDWLASQASPPDVVPDDDPVPVVPVDGPPPPDGSDPPTQPVVRPEGAVGAIIQLTTVPAYQPWHGKDPKFWPGLGHVAYITEWGPMPSVLIKHNPMVLLGMPPQVESLQLDLAEGVVGTVQWLRGAR